MNDDLSEDEPAHSLVMPFVVCEDQGGPYKADAFVAGYEAGHIDFTLRMLKPMGGTLVRWVPPELLPQLDLLAMHYGFTMTSEPWDEYPEEWAKVTFEPQHWGSPADG